MLLAFLFSAFMYTAQHFALMYSTHFSVKPASQKLHQSPVYPWINAVIGPFLLISCFITSRQNRGSGPGCRHEWDGVWCRLQDQEGHVPHRGTAVQGAVIQADGHAEEHQPQLCPLHHPQSWEKGELHDCHSYPQHKLDWELYYPHIYKFCGIVSQSCTVYSNITQGWLFLGQTH